MPPPPSRPTRARSSCTSPTSSGSTTRTAPRTSGLPAMPWPGSGSSPPPASGVSMTPSPEQLLRVLRDHGLRDIQTLTPADGGESKSAFLAADRSGRVSIVKFLPGRGPDAENQLRDLDTTVRRLRERGYPAPALEA